MKILRASIDEQQVLHDLIYASKKSNGYTEAEMKTFEPVLTIPRRVFDMYLVYKAVDQDKIIGVLVIKNMKIRCVLEDLFVLPERQGTGVGSKLAEFAEQQARALGYDSIHLHSDPNSEQFYKKIGYQTYGYVKSKLIPGRTLPMMRKSL